MTIIFRLNANSTVGFGHLNRCRALAYALKMKGQSCIMVGPQKKYKNVSDESIFKDWIPIDRWNSAEQDSENLIKIAKKNKKSFLILDDYRINESYQLNLRKESLKWLQFDHKENSRPIWADIILNPMPGVHDDEFKNIIKNKKSDLLLGPDYAILRPEFANVKKKNNTKTNKTILVTFGGGNDYGGIIFVLSTLVPLVPSNFKFVVVSGRNNPNNKIIDEWIVNHGTNKVDLHIDPKNLVNIFSSCDFAITAGGTTTYELDSCSLQFIIISTTSNQIEQSKAWESAGRALYIGELKNISKKSLISSFNSIINNKKILNSGKNLSSYEGLYKVADIVIKKKLINYHGN